jgi:dTMP kinase
VVSDRFADSTSAYQGYAGGVPLDDLERLHRIVAGGFRPDLTLVLDLPAEAGLARAGGRGGAVEDRFEKKGLAFHEALRRGFLEIARSEPERCAVIDAAAGVEDVHQAVWETVRRRLGLP